MPAITGTLSQTLGGAVVHATNAPQATPTLSRTLGQLTSIGDESAPPIAGPIADAPVAASVATVYPKRAWPA